MATASVANNGHSQPTPGDRRLEGVQVPALALQKVAPREIQVNREATFETVIRNTGKVAAHDVVVHDFVPQGTELLESDPPTSLNEQGRLQWRLGTLVPGQQATIKMKLLPRQPGSIGSVAHVTFGAQAAAQTICTQPKLVLRHQAPETVLIGQEVLLDIYVENQGTGAAENVVILEDVPEAFVFAGGQKELEYQVGTLQPGEVRNIKLRLTAAKVGQVRNVLAAHGAGKLNVSDTTNIRVVAPSLTLVGEGPNLKYLNRQATHSFTVSNRGTAAATNLQMVARLPRGLRFVEANNQGQYDPNAHAVVWRLARLDSNKAGKVELTTMPVATGKQDISVEVVSDLNQQESTVQSLHVEQLVELFYDIEDVADPIETGAQTAYRVRVANQGQKTATNVRIQVDLPDAILPKSVDGNVPNEIRGQSVLLQPIAALQPGQEVSFVVHAQGVRPGEHRAKVSVSSDDREVAVSKEESTHVYSDR